MASEEREFETSSDFDGVRMEYFKERAREALVSGNYKEAYSTYTKCLEELRPRNSSQRCKLLCNRSMAYAKSSNFKAALEDGESAIAAMPSFAKAWWRKATAHVGLRQFPEALAAYKQSLELQPDSDDVVANEHLKIMNRTVLSFTREQLADWILENLKDMETRELIQPTHLENVTSLEMREGMFCQIKAIGEISEKPGDYYHFVQHWNIHGMSTAMAYVQRASMYRHAMCFKQARADAAMALTLLQEDPSSSLKDGEMAFTHRADDFSPVKESQVKTKAWAWYEMGMACKEDGTTGDANAVSAAKCFAAISEEKTEYPLFTNAFQLMCDSMTNVEASKLLSAVNDQFSVTEFGLQSVPTGGKTYLVSVSAVFPHASLVKFNFKVRESFRQSIADGAEVKREKVLLENVQGKGEKGVVVSYRILTGEDKLKSEVRIIKIHHAHPLMILAQELVERISNKDLNLLGGSEFTSAMGSPSDVTSAVKELQSEDLVDRISSLQGIILNTLKSGKEIVVASRPPKDMELPYRTYKLVYTDGSPVERVNKGPYQMSQLHYSAQGMHKREVWVEMMDKSCRWRQSSSEVAIQALQVPKDAKKQDLDVCITSSTIRVSCRKSGRTYLEGELFREIIPEESAWVHLGGENDDGFVLYLKKMNLELFKTKRAQATDSWWDRLFMIHGDIRFDDYDKDLTDLPTPVAEAITAIEAESDAKSMIDDGEHNERESAHERNDVRKRNRQVRLAELRGGKYLSWVELNRRNPAPNPLAKPQEST